MKDNFEMRWRHAFISICTAALAFGLISASVAGQRTQEFPISLLGLEGHQIQISGFLIFGFENKNLYASPKWQSAWEKGLCIPMGVPSRDRAMDERLEKLSRSFVTVRGTVQRLIGENQINASFCQNVGLLVESIFPLGSRKGFNGLRRKL